MRPVPVVVAAVDAEHVFEVSTAEDQDPVEALAAKCAHPALGVGVRVRRPERRSDDPDALALEDGVEAAAELAVAIVQQKAPNGCCRSPSVISRLRACCATQRPSGLLVQATYSIRRRSSEMKKST